MKELISQWFHGREITSTREKLRNLRELRAIESNGVKIYADHVADVLSAKSEIFNNPIEKDPSRYRTRVLSVSKTVLPNN